MGAAGVSFVGGALLALSSCAAELAALAVARRARVARGRGAAPSWAVRSATGEEGRVGACASLCAAASTPEGAAAFRVRVVRRVGSKVS